MSIFVIKKPFSQFFLLFFSPGHSDRIWTLDPTIMIQVFYHCAVRTQQHNLLLAKAKRPSLFRPGIGDNGQKFVFNIGIDSNKKFFFCLKSLWRENEMVFLTKKCLSFLWRRALWSKRHLAELIFDKIVICNNIFDEKLFISSNFLTNFWAFWGTFILE